MEFSLEETTGFGNLSPGMYETDGVVHKVIIALSLSFSYYKYYGGTLEKSAHIVIVLSTLFLNLTFTLCLLLSTDFLSQIS